MRTAGSAPKISSRWQQDIQGLSLLVMSLVTFWLKFNETFKFGRTGAQKHAQDRLERAACFCVNTLFLRCARSRLTLCQVFTFHSFPEICGIGVTLF